jgi:hypothetical protein
VGRYRARITIKSYSLNVHVDVSDQKLIKTNKHCCRNTIKAIN